MNDMAPFDFLRYGYGFWLKGTLRLLLWAFLAPWYIYIEKARKEKKIPGKIHYLIVSLLVFVFFFRRGILFGLFLASYRELGMITGYSAFSSYARLPKAVLAFGDMLGNLELHIILFLLAWNVVCYNGDRTKIFAPCDRKALSEIWRKAQGSTKKMLWILLRWGIIMPLLLSVEFLFMRVSFPEWLSTWHVLLLLPDQLVQRIQPHCPATYVDTLLGIGKVWLSFTASLALGVYLAPRQWLRHLWRGRWETVWRLTPLALLQGLAALYLFLPGPLTLTSHFISRVTCDPRFLVPPEPWRSVFAVLNGAVFGVAISVLGLLLLQCYDEGRCWLGVEVAFIRLRPGAGRERAQQDRRGRWLYELRRWVVRPLLLGVGLWGGWQIGQSLLSALLA